MEKYVGHFSQFLLIVILADLEISLIYSILYGKYMHVEFWIHTWHSLLNMNTGHIFGCYN